MIYLVVVHGPDRGRSFQLENGRCYEIGRSLDDLPLADSKLSRRHAEFISHDGDWFLTDLGSTNGTYVNGERVDKRCRLFDNDRVQVGNTLMVFGTAEAHRQRQEHGTMPVLHETHSTMGPSSRSGQNDQTLELDAVDDLNLTEALQDHAYTPTASPDRSITSRRSAATQSMQHRRGTVPDPNLVPAELDDDIATAITVHNPADMPIYAAHSQGWKIVLVVLVLIAGGLVGLFLYDKQERELLMMRLTSQTRANADFAHEKQLDEILSEVRRPNHDIYVNEKLDHILSAVSNAKQTGVLDGHTLASRLHEAIGAEQSQQTQALLEKTLAAVEATAETEAVSGAEQRELQKQMMAMLLELKTEITALRKTQPPHPPHPPTSPTTPHSTPPSPTHTQTPQMVQTPTGRSDRSGHWPAKTTANASSGSGLSTPSAHRPVPRAQATSATPTRIAFVVDASATMRDVMPSILRLLQRTVTRLDETKSTTLIFYQNNRVIEVEPYGFKPANEASRQAMIQWLAPNNTRILPQGEANPQLALERATRYQPDVIWLLTDHIEQADVIFNRLAVLNRDGAIRINTMQLLDQDPTGSLSALAQQNGGTHHQVKRSDLRRFDPRVSLR